MKETIYRLGEYKIIEFDTGQLMWEAHFGFGEFQTGQCFRKGSILFIGPAEDFRDGFLKGEFLDDIKKYPQWVNTNYYCTGIDVKHCKTGKSVAKEEMMLWTLGRNKNEGIKVDPDVAKNYSIGVAAAKVTKNVLFSLQRYEIIVRTDGQIISRTYSGANSVSSGNCFILENILFVGPQHNKPFSLNKRQFLANLRKLPRWDLTEYFCKRFSFHDCEPGSRIHGERKNLSPMGNATKKHDAESAYKANSEAKIPKGAYRASFSKRLSAILSSFADFLKSRDESGRFSNFRCIKPYFSKIIAIFLESGIWIIKRITRTVAIVFLIIATLFDFISGYLKKLHEKWHRKKTENSLDHHEDH